MEKFFKHPWIIVAAVTAVTAFFAAQIPRAELDNNTMSFLPESNPAKLIARHFEKEYGDSIAVMVGLERKYGTVFDSAFLSRIREFSAEVEAIPLVKKTNSIMSTQYITSDRESIIVTDLVGDDFAGTPEEIAELKRRIDSWDMYRGALVSDDGSSTQIVIQLNATADHAGDREVMAVLTQIRDGAKAAFAGLAEVYTAGQPVVSASLSEQAFADLLFTIPLVAVVLLVVLALSFRRFSYITLPLLAVVVAAVVSVGAMPLSGIRLTMMSLVLPVIMFAVGSAYGIHLVSHYRDDIANKTFTAAEHRQFVFSLARRLVKPVMLAALTTLAGFVSLCFAPLSAMRDFGVFSSLGVVAAFLTALTLIPAILLIRGPRAVKLAAQKRGGAQKDGAAQKHGAAKPQFNFDDVLSGALTNLARKKGLVFTVTALLIIAAVAGSFNVVVDNAMVEFFNPASEVSRSDRFIREHFGGSTQFIVSVEAESTEALLHPDTLAAADGLCAYLKTRVPNVGNVTGFTDMVKRMNQMFNVDESPAGLRTANHVDADFTDDEFGFGDFGFEDREDVEPPDDSAVIPADYSPAADSQTSITFAMLNAALGKKADMSANELARELERMTNYEGYSYYEIPADPARYGKSAPEELGALVANYLVLLAGGSDDSFSNDPLEPTAFETVVLVNSQWQEDADRVVDEINRYAAANFPPGVKVVVGGGATQEGAISSLVTHSQIISIIMSVLSVLLIVAVSNKSLAAGFIAALPLSIAVLCDFALMGFLHITLNMGTALLASLTVGIGIDYTIHCMETFKREFLAGGAAGNGSVPDRNDYLRRTFATSGKAIIINAVSVGASFAVLMFSQFRIVAQFGMLVALSMAVSAVVSLTVVPALLEAVKPRFIFGAQKA